MPLQIAISRIGRDARRADQTPEGRVAARKFVSAAGAAQKGVPHADTSQLWRWRASKKKKGQSESKLALFRFSRNANGSGPRRRRAQRHAPSLSGSTWRKSLSADPANRRVFKRTCRFTDSACISEPAAMTPAAINTSAAPSRGHGESCIAARAWPETPCEPGCLLGRATPAPDGRRSSWPRLG